MLDYHSSDQSQVKKVWKWKILIPVKDHSQGTEPIVKIATGQYQSQNQNQNQDTEVHMHNKMLAKDLQLNLSYLPPWNQ